MMENKREGMDGGGRVKASDSPFGKTPHFLSDIKGVFLEIGIIKNLPFLCEETPSSLFRDAQG